MGQPESPEAARADARDKNIADHFLPDVAAAIIGARNALETSAMCCRSCHESVSQAISPYLVAALSVPARPAPAEEELARENRWLRERLSKLPDCGVCGGAGDWGPLDGECEHCGGSGKEPNTLLLQNARSAIEAAQGVIGQCDCIMSESANKDPKRLWRKARDRYRAALASVPARGREPGPCEMNARCLSCQRSVVGCVQDSTCDNRADCALKGYARALSAAPRPPSSEGPAPEQVFRDPGEGGP